MTGAARPDVRPAVLGGERLEDRLEPRDRLVIAGGHQAEADLESPDAAGDADVHEVNPIVLRLLVAPLRVVEVRIAAVDDRVALVGNPEQLVENVLGDLPGRNHQPEGAWRLELLL